MFHSHVRYNFWFLFLSHIWSVSSSWPVHGPVHVFWSVTGWKFDNELLSLGLFGRAFHTVGAATEKARLPNSVRVHWTWLSMDRSKREDVTGCMRVERYDGVKVERSLYVSSATSSVIRLCRMCNKPCHGRWLQSRLRCRTARRHGVNASLPFVHRRQVNPTCREPGARFSKNLKKNLRRS